MHRNSGRAGSADAAWLLHGGEAGIGTAAPGDRFARPGVSAGSASPAAAPSRWQDAPATPGDWRWRMEGGQSIATFGDGLLILRCDVAQRMVTVQRSGADAAPTPLIITTSSMTRALNGEASSAGLSASLLANDPLLDAMAFSRGRFAVEAGGMPPVFAPSWSEVGRVVQDCR